MGIVILLVLILIVILKKKPSRKYGKYTIAYIDGDVIKYVEFIDVNSIYYNRNKDRCLKFDTLEDALQEKDKCRFSYELAIVFI